MTFTLLHLIYLALRRGEGRRGWGGPEAKTSQLFLLSPPPFQTPQIRGGLGDRSKNWVRERGSGFGELEAPLAIRNAGEGVGCCTSSRLFGTGELGSGSQWKSLIIEAPFSLLPLLSPGFQSPALGLDSNPRHLLAFGCARSPRPALQREAE